MPYSMMKVSEVLLLTGHLSGWGKKKCAGNFVCSGTGFQGLCNYTRVVEILGFS